MSRLITLSEGLAVHAFIDNGFVAGNIQGDNMVGLDGKIVDDVCISFPCNLEEDECEICGRKCDTI